MRRAPSFINIPLSMFKFLGLNLESALSYTIFKNLCVLDDVRFHDNYLLGYVKYLIEKVEKTGDRYVNVPFDISEVLLYYLVLLWEIKKVKYDSEFTHIDQVIRYFEKRIDMHYDMLYCYFREKPREDDFYVDRQTRRA